MFVSPSSLSSLLLLRFLGKGHFSGFSTSKLCVYLLGAHKVVVWVSIFYNIKARSSLTGTDKKFGYTLISDFGHHGHSIGTGKSVLHKASTVRATLIGKASKVSNLLWSFRKPSWCSWLILLKELSKLVKSILEGPEALAKHCGFSCKIKVPFLMSLMATQPRSLPSILNHITSKFMF